MMDTDDSELQVIETIIRRPALEEIAVLSTESAFLRDPPRRFDACNDQSIEIVGEYSFKLSKGQKKKAKSKAKTGTAMRSVVFVDDKEPSTSEKQPQSSENFFVIDSSPGPSCKLVLPDFIPLESSTPMTARQSSHVDSQKKKKKQKASVMTPPSSPFVKGKKRKLVKGHITPPPSDLVMTYNRRVVLEEQKDSQNFGHSNSIPVLTRTFSNSTPRTQQLAMAFMARNAPPNVASKPEFVPGPSQFDHGPGPSRTDLEPKRDSGPLQPDSLSGRFERECFPRFRPDNTPVNYLADPAGPGLAPGLQRPFDSPVFIESIAASQKFKCLPRKSKGGISKSKPRHLPEPTVGPSRPDLVSGGPRSTHSVDPSQKAKCDTKSKGATSKATEQDIYVLEQRTPISKPKNAKVTLRRSDKMTPHKKTGQKWAQAIRKSSRESVQQPADRENEAPAFALQQLHLRALRPVIVDGANVGYRYSKCFNKNILDFKGIQLVFRYFKSRGHVVHVVLTDKLEQRACNDPCMKEVFNAKGVVFTPHLKQPGFNDLTLYDDRFVVQLAAEQHGLIVSADFYRDVIEEAKANKLHAWIVAMTQRLLIPTFAAETVLFDPYPYGNGGPRLEELLRM